MIKSSKQQWKPGQQVKVGFMSLNVVVAVPTPGDYAPDAYVLTNTAGTKLYKFVPHNGLQSLTPEEARELIAEAAALAQRQAAEEVQKLRNAARTMDMLSQDGFGEIATIARHALKGLDTPACRQACYSIAQALNAIWAKADDAMNSINLEAEKVGSDYVDEAKLRRQDAQAAVRAKEIHHV